MTPYLIFFSFYLTAYFALEAITWRRAEPMWTTGCVLILPLVVFAVIFAGHIGTDSTNYGEIYQSPEDSLVEPGFAMFMAAANHVGMGYVAFAKVVVVIQLLLLTLIVVRLRDPLFFLLFYLASFYLNFQFNQVRNSLALLVVVASYVWLRRSSILSLVAASTIHYSSPITFGLQFLANSRYRKVAMILVFISSGLLLVLFVLPRVLDNDWVKALFVYQEYLGQDFETKAIYPALLVKLAVVFILFRNGGNVLYLVTYAILVAFIHFVSPILNRVCELVLFLALVDFCLRHRLRPNWTRLTAIGLSLVLVVSSLLIPWEDCQKGGSDNWCVDRMP